MTEQEKINADVQMKLAMQDAKFNVFMQEMRDRDNQRAAEIMELRQEIRNMQANLDAKIDSMGKHVRNLAITSMAAVGGMFIAVKDKFLTCLPISSMRFCMLLILVRISRMSSAR